MAGISSFISFHTSRKEVEAFIKELKEIIGNDTFRIESNFFLNTAKEKNVQTLLDLDYNEEDVLEILSGLTVKDYSETRIDTDNQNPPLLYVFGVILQNNEVYIKVKNRSTPQRKIICVSFHWSEHTMGYPYKK